MVMIVGACCWILLAIISFRNKMDIHKRNFSAVFLLSILTSILCSLHKKTLEALPLFSTTENLNSIYVIRSSKALKTSAVNTGQREWGQGSGARGAPYPGHRQLQPSEIWLAAAATNCSPTCQPQRNENRPTMPRTRMVTAASFKTAQHWTLTCLSTEEDPQ